MHNVIQVTIGGHNRKLFRKTLIVIGRIAQFSDSNNLIITHGVGDSIRFQIVFYITSVSDAAGPRNLMTFPNIY